MPPGAARHANGDQAAPTPRSPRRYDDLIRQHAGQHGLSPDLVRAVIQAESNFNRYAISPKGAMGLMQLMPATARELGVDDPFHPDENIRGGVSYLAGLLARYDQNVELALAAYNAGPGQRGALRRRAALSGDPRLREEDHRRRRSARAATPRESVIYRWIEMVDGQTRTRYSNVPPKDQPYEIVGKR